MMSKNNITLPHGRNLLISKDSDAAVQAAVAHFIECGKAAIEDRGAFYVALSGGSTPKAIYNALSQPQYRQQLAWDKVFLGWGDERCVPPDDNDSNYRMAMQNGFASLPIPKDHIWRMEGEKDPIEAADGYSALLYKELPDLSFDLMMLGIGDDGHTASLFPHTTALSVKNDPVAANWVEKLGCWRLTLTYPCINAARNIAVYVLGAGKAAILEKVVLGPQKPAEYPVQGVGSAQQPTTWFVDEAAVKRVIERD